MKRSFSVLTALAMACSLGAYAQAGTMHSMHSHSKMMHSCPAGQHWVHGYTTKAGKKIHGYCRK